MSNHLCNVRMSGRTAFVVGLAGALAGGALGSLLGRSSKPLAVAAIKRGLIIGANVQARAAELREDLDDIVAQARHDYRAERMRTTDQNKNEGA